MAHQDKDLSDSLARSEARFRAFAECASDWFWEMDAHLRFIWFSDRFQEITGVDPQQLLGKTREETGIPDVDPAEWSEHLRCLHAHEAFNSFVHPRRQANGEQVWLSISGRPHFDSEGRFVGYHGVGRDITQQRLYEEGLKHQRRKLEMEVRRRTVDLENAMQKAEKANLAKSEFLANISHELRTPMHGITSFAKLGIKKSTSGDPQKMGGYFQRIETSADRLMALLNDLLDLSKLEAGHFEMNLECTCLHQLLHSVIDELSARLQESRITISVSNLIPQTDTVIDKAKMAQVIRNLLVNAFKFSKEGSHIECEISGSHDSHIELTIHDQGVGIPEDELNQIFDKFVQSSKTKTGAGGTGLGLAICKEIVEMHGGTISAKNNERGGASFTVSVPKSHSNSQVA
ncbi:MAG: PAS domain-containing sensor histidine kinase [Pseudomonadota bacterium]